ncbi:alpha/beta fold hydrolase [Intrasporangium sp. DVR]|uniref:alpha/beta hydrolase n=1 Tax=Intrasporangium sp. DVR TaxID=3127867 RepID=UPI00313A51BC
MRATFRADERQTLVGPRGVRSLHHLPRGGEPAADGALVVVLPGLGLPGYTLPTADAIAARGIECAVLDVPGFGSSQPRSARPHIEAVGALAAQWVAQVAEDRPVVVLGHSTGAQAALATALALEPRRALALVMAGPTFRPEHRHVLRLLGATPLAYRKDRLAEVDVREVLRARLDLVRLVVSGVRDVPEARIAALAAPVTLIAGEHDSYAPREWLAALADAASRSTRVRTAVVHGSHNNLYTHPDELADAVLLALADARGRSGA